MAFLRFLLENNRPTSRISQCCMQLFVVLSCENCFLTTRHSNSPTWRAANIHCWVTYIHQVSLGWVVVIIISKKRLHKEVLHAWKYSIPLMKSGSLSGLQLTICPPPFHAPTPTVHQDHTGRIWHCPSGIQLWIITTDWFNKHQRPLYSFAEYGVYTMAAHIMKLSRSV